MLKPLYLKPLNCYHFSQSSDDMPQLKAPWQSGERLPGTMCTCGNNKRELFLTTSSKRTSQDRLSLSYLSQINQINAELPSVRDQKAQGNEQSHASLVSNTDFPQVPAVFTEKKLEAHSIPLGSRFLADHIGGYVVGESIYSLRNYVPSPNK